MHCFDSTFLIDYVRGEPLAVEKVRLLVESAERLTTPAVAAAELLIGAYFRGSGELARTLEFLERVDVLGFDVPEAAEAGRLGAECLRRGSPLVGIDLLVAATARLHRGVLVSRDGVFSQVPGLAVESY